MFLLILDVYLFLRDISLPLLRYLLPSSPLTLTLPLSVPLPLTPTLPHFLTTFTLPLCYQVLLG